MKKISKVLLLICILSFSFCTGVLASANSAAPIRQDRGSGILFEKHENVKIDSEVLDIDMSGHNAKITATYKMTNTSDKALSVYTMFLSPVELEQRWNYLDRGYVVTKNGKNIDYTSEYFTYNNYLGSEKIDDWEQVLANVKSPSKPLGDGGGYKEYIFKGNGNKFNINFTAQKQFIDVGNNTYQLNDNKSITLSSYFDDIVILSNETLEVTSENLADTIINGIDDVYDYIFNNGIKNEISFDEKFAQSQFNEYLYDLGKKIESNEKYIESFRFTKTESCIVAVNYYVEFAPNETLELTVSYLYKVGYGRSDFRDTSYVNYFLTPTKYWNDFGDITINLTMNKVYPRLKQTSVKFSKISKGKYIYQAKQIPTKELLIVSESGINKKGVNIIVTSSLIIGGIMIAAGFIIFFTWKKRNPIKKRLK